MIVLVDIAVTDKVMINQLLDVFVCCLRNMRRIDNNITKNEL